jgi:HD-GYP domain-containing protein (c-di-GMP phosphodiesterase class II)
MLTTHPAKSSGAHRLEHHARALAVILREEFDEPVLFQDARTGAVVHWAGSTSPPSGLELTQVAELAVSGQARVVSGPGGGSPGEGYRVAIPLYAAEKPILVGSFALTPLAGQDTDALREAKRVQKWAQSVCERLRSSDYILARGRGAEEENSQGKVAWEAILRLDQLLRRLRVYKNSDGNEERILQAVFDLLGAESLIWVPCDPSAPVSVLGTAVHAVSDYRQLSLLLTKNPELRRTHHFLCNDVASLSWSARFPGVMNLMAFRVADQVPLGMVIALNKQARGRASEAGDCIPFRTSDAALLTPFVALLVLQARATGRYQDLKDLLVGLTRSLTAALDAKDPYTFGHSERVARVAVELGRELGLDDDELGNIYLAGLLHDIGKIGIRDAVLTKAGPLTPEEFAHIKEHVTLGYAILADLKQIRDLLPGVLYHHEQYDGSGYPEGLEGESIPFLARILAVADAYDAMSTTRPYRTAMSRERVEEILVQGAGKQWDRRVIDAFLRCRQTIFAVRQRGLGGSLRQALDGALQQNDLASIAVSAIGTGEGR